MASNVVFDPPGAPPTGSPTNRLAIRMTQNFDCDDQAACYPEAIRGKIPQGLKQRGIFRVRKGDEGFLVSQNPKRPQAWVEFLSPHGPVHVVVPSNSFARGRPFRPLQEKLAESFTVPIPADQSLDLSIGHDNISRFCYRFWGTVGNAQNRHAIINILGMPSQIYDRFFSAENSLRMVNTALDGILPAVRNLFQKQTWTIHDILNLRSATPNWPGDGVTIYVRPYTHLDERQQDVNDSALYVGSSNKVCRRHDQHERSIAKNDPSRHYTLAARSNSNNRKTIPLIFWPLSTYDTISGPYKFVAEQLIMGALFTWHDDIVTAANNPSVRQNWVSGSAFLCKIAQSTRLTVGLPNPPWKGANVASPIFQYKDAPFDIPCYRMEDRNIYRLPARFTKTSGASTLYFHIRYHESGQQLKTAPFSIGGSAAKENNLPDIFLCYLVFEVMRGGKMHDHPFVGSPRIGPFENFDSASRLGIRVEWHDKTQRKWLSLRLQHSNYNWPRLHQTRDPEDAIMNWRHAMKLIQLFEGIEYVGSEMDGFPRRVWFGNKRIVTLQVDHLQQKALWTTRPRQTQPVPRRTTFAKNVKAIKDTFVDDKTIIRDEGPPPFDSPFWRPVESDVVSMARRGGRTRCDLCMVSRRLVRPGASKRLHWDCVRDDNRTDDVWVCVCCSALNRLCTFSAMSTLANKWGNHKPSLTQYAPLSMCSRTEWRFMTFYRTLTPAELQTAQTIAAPFGDEKNLIDFADVEEEEQEVAVPEEDLEEDE
ncbi:unnamed protein product [Clonostachys chloroleuca]|uniref:Uncharacterized protein n=1 Tax=Clonostachys chloroleuca TaxID=1926264 RepID=A0AA35VSD2_9HYPO|nr:unnamed protein product [Clonostachys chloroleuca]